MTMSSFVFALLVVGQQSVSASLVCQVQEAIRHQRQSWDRGKCKQVAAAMNQTLHPRMTLAIAILESRLRPDAFVDVRPGVADVGLMGVRCVLGEEGQCSNGPAKGITIDELKDAVTNVQVAGEIMKQKQAALGKRWLCGYGGTAGKRSRCPYSRTVTSMDAALAGRRPTDGIRRADLILLVWKAITDGSRRPHGSRLDRQVNGVLTP